MFDPKKRPTKAYLNYLLVSRQKRLRRSMVLGYPYVIMVDTTNFCNLRCPFCPTGQGMKKNTIKPKVMGVENFKKIFSQLENYLFCVDFYNWGEPLLNPKIFEIIKHVSDKGIFTRMSSNLNLLDERLAERIIDSGLDLLVVSIDGTTSRTYRKYRIGGDFDKVLNNLKILIAKKKEMNRDNPKVLWQFLVFRHNEHEVEKAEKMARELGVDIFVPGYSAYIPTEDYEKWAPKSDKHVRFEKTRAEEYCDWPWVAATVDSEGKATTCCFLYEKPIGDLKESSFWRIWNSEEYRKARKYIRTKRSTGGVCDGCMMNGRVPVHFPVKEEVEKEAKRRLSLLR